MAVRVVKLGFVGLNVVDKDAMLNHFSTIIGLPILQESRQDTYLACGSEAHVLGLYRGGSPGLRHFGLRIDQDMTLTDAEKHLLASGIATQANTDMFPGIPATLTIHDPDGNVIHLYSAAARPAVAYGQSGVQPIKLGHVALFVRDWRISAQFYRDVLGFRLSDWCDDVFAFLRCNSEHHTVNLTNHPRGGLFHVAFEVRDLGHIGRACDHLAENGVSTVWGPGRHGIGHSLFAYHRDPDGNIIELMAEMDRMSNEGIGYFDPRPCHEDMPQRPKAWTFSPESSNTWGIMPPDNFMG